MKVSYWGKKCVLILSTIYNIIQFFLYFECKVPCLTIWVGRQYKHFEDNNSDVLMFVQPFTTPDPVQIA